MSQTLPNPIRETSAVTSWQTVRALISHCRMLAIVLALIIGISCQANSQIYDSLDAYPPRFFLDTSDCKARVLAHDNLPTDGVGGGACEQLTFTAASGSEAILVYPIEPVRPLDDLTATLSIMSARGGAAVGLRIRYPFLKDPETRRPVSTIVYGASYTTPGEFASLGIGMMEKAVRLKDVALRSQFGPSADLSDAYVDGVVVNAYAGPGKTSIRLDELRVDGLIPVSVGIVMGNQRSSDSEVIAGRRSPDGGDSAFTPSPIAFPLGQITKILEHNGEPLGWVRTLGFDAVLLREPPDAAILAEAIRTRMKIYAPAPTNPDPSIEAMLEPVVGWYVGGKKALDSREIEDTKLLSEQLRAFPSRWQRPIIAAPSESWQRYAPMFDAMIHDLPPRVRSLRGHEEVAELHQRGRWVGDRVQVAVGINSMPPDEMVQQVESIASAIGSPMPDGYRWHSMWMQAMRSLQSSPTAILFRSTRSLSSGTPADQRRATSLSYINRMVAMLQPWVTSSTRTPPPAITGTPYQCGRSTSGGTDLLILTSELTRGQRSSGG